ncbi:hypothetical protein AFM12_09450 [Jiulongibacter sediminis]|uniref:Tetratricopeptide repeat protein n=2 Tax=Jiulongibacter sediminis TaxID=1605367 RepID=A0A0P7BNI3_9BACT|nr:hypothetical protein AFM12_09450 [Jiulongibacter sediminis]TBX25323.1 hypothetical protein TK44_09455 [Jiulongibacter sediminis]
MPKFDEYHSHFMKHLRPKRLLSWFILFSFACGPGPLDFEEFFTLFDPAVAERPAATDEYFFTHNYLNFYGEGPNSQQLSDSLNLESWYQYADQKISKDEFRKGLYDTGNGLKLANKLRAMGKTEAADYVLLAQEIDKETQKFGNYWEPAPLVNEQLLADLRDYVMMNILAAREDFIKERYTFQAMKIDAKLNDHVGLIDDYNTLDGEYKTKTFISDWIESRVAGAHLGMGDTAKAVLEFAKIFEKSPTRRNQADLSVRRLELKNFDAALNLAKNDQEKAAVLTLQAIQPFQDGLPLMKEIASLDLNHTMLPLIMSREINKNEVGFYAKQNAGMYAYQLDVYDDNYKIDSAKVAQRNKEAESYFEELLSFNQTLLKNDKLQQRSFWLASAAYLNFIAGQFDTAEKQVKEALQQNPTIDLQSQLLFLETVISLKTDGLEKEGELLIQIEKLQTVENFRDNNRLAFVTEQLAQKYLEAEDQKNDSGGFLSSCSKKEAPFPRAKVKAFLAKISGGSDYEYQYQTGYHKTGLLYQQNAETLSNLLEFITEKAETSEDQKLIELANLKMDDLRLALGRKLVREQKYPEALAQFQACDPSIFNQEAFSQYFSAYPRQYVGSRDLEEDPLQPLEYFKKVATYQQETTENPDDAWAWYNLGLAAYNMSYWGEGWLFSDRMWGAMEIEYGDPTDEDYFTNDYAKACFEKALAANPEPELGAQICYMGALCERNQYYIAYTNGRPDTYKQEELDYYRIKMETSVKPTFQSFFKRLKNQYDETEFESQVIKECITYVNYKLQ